MCATSITVMDFEWKWFDEALAVVNVVTIFIGNSVSIVLIQKRLGEIIRLAKLDDLPEENICHLVASEAINTGMLLGVLKMVYLALEMLLALFLAVQVCSRLVKGTNQKGICARIWSSLQFLFVILLIFDLTIFAQLKTARQTSTIVWKLLLLSWRIFICIYFARRFLQLYKETCKNNTRSANIPKTCHNVRKDSLTSMAGQAATSGPVHHLGTRSSSNKVSSKIAPATERTQNPDKITSEKVK